MYLSLTITFVFMLQNWAFLLCSNHNTYFTTKCWQIKFDSLDILVTNTTIVMDIVTNKAITSFCYVSIWPGPSIGTSPDVISQDAFIAEIKRLRERLVTLETENAALSMKLSQQQWEVSTFTSNKDPSEI